MHKNDLEPVWGWMIIYAGSSDTTQQKSRHPSVDRNLKKTKITKNLTSFPTFSKLPHIWSDCLCWDTNLKELSMTMHKTPMTIVVHIPMERWNINKFQLNSYSMIRDFTTNMCYIFFSLLYLLGWKYDSSGNQDSFRVY